ncbi:hypothetical protein Hanom_Chr03g00189961 [Helianthus anomalus]
MTWCLSTIRISVMVHCFRDDVIKQLVRELKYLDETLPLRIKVGVNNDDFPTIYPPFSADDGHPSWSEV